MTYRGFAAGAADWSRIFIALGVSKGDHVGILLPNGTQFMQVLFGSMLAGAVPVPINVRYRGPEMADLLADAELVTVVTTNDVEYHPSLIERLHEALPELSSAGAPERLALGQAPRLRNIVAAQGPPSPGILHLSAVAASAARIADEEIEKRRRSVRPEDTALILYTSGSTARPKGCMLSHAAIVTQGRLLAGRYQMTARDRIWSPLPMFHVGGISPLMAIISVGGAYLSMRKIEAGPGLAMMAGERATISFALFQTIIADLLQHPRFAEHDLSAIRLMVSNFSLQPPWIRELLADRLPRAVQIGTFGLTETVASACTHSPDDAADDRLNRLGRPLPGIEVRIIDEGGRDAAPGIIGEVLLRGSHFVQRLLQGPGKDGGRAARWLAPHRRSRQLGCPRLGDVPWPPEGCPESRRRECGCPGNRDRGRSAPRGEGLRGGRRAGPAARGSAGGIRRTAAGRRGHRGADRGLLQGQAGEFQGPAARTFSPNGRMSATKIDKPALVKRLIAEGAAVRFDHNGS